MTWAPLIVMGVVLFALTAAVVAAQRPRTLAALAAVEEALIGGPGKLVDKADDRLRYRAREGGWSMVVAPDSDGLLLATLELAVTAPTGAGFRPEGPLPGGDAELGDPMFDGQVHLRGDPRWLAAVFDADARSRLRALMRSGGVTLDGGLLRVEKRLVEAQAPEIESWIAAALAFARALELPRKHWGARLTEQAQTDPVAAVRASAGRALLRGLRGTPEATAFADWVLDSTMSALHLEAASSLEDGAKARLLALAADFDYPDDERTEALRRAAALPGDPPPDDWLPAMLHATVDELQAAAFGIAADLARADLLLRPDGRLRFGPLTGARAALAEALRRLGAAVDLQVLLPWLSVSDPAVRIAAAGALGALADARAVEPLRAMERTSGRAEARAARAAIAAIQQRIGDRGAGGLALVDAGGELSLLEQEGELTLTNDPGRGALSKAKG